MPELPEVETIRRQLESCYKNKVIREVVAQDVKIFQNVTSAEFSQAVAGHKINAFYRQGKFMYWDLGDLFPVIHLGMSGIFLTDRNASRQPKHIHIEFIFDDGDRLYFQDVRKFGKIYLYQKRPDFPDLGIDPTDEKFTLIKFMSLLNLKGIKIKSLLMNQKNIAGIGNIYASEALFLAGIHPERAANKISEKESAKLYKAIILTVAKAKKKM